MAESFFARRSDRNPIATGKKAARKNKLRRDSFLRIVWHNQPLGSPQSQ
jgi:hypothetical protein